MFLLETDLLIAYAMGNDLGITGFKNNAGSGKKGCLLSPVILSFRKGLRPGPSTIRSYLAYLYDREELRADFAENRLFWHTVKPHKIP